MNLGQTGTKLFTNYLTDFCDDTDLLISSQLLLPSDTYSYVSTREGVFHYSWLDHVVSSRDFHKCINDISLLYDMSDEDHIPFCINLNISSLPKVTLDCNDYNANIPWDRVKECDLMKYSNFTDKHLSNIDIPVEALICRDVNCKSDLHKSMLETFLCNIIKCLNLSSSHLSCNNNTFFNKPGWTEYVSEIYNYSREIRQLWMENGKPRQGFIFNELNRSKTRFKYALRFIKKNETNLRKESLANKMTNLSSNEFWKEISSINNSKTPLPCTVEDANGPQEIIKLWEKHYYDIFNCLPKVGFNSNLKSNSTYDNVKVSCREIIDSIKSLKDNKSCGLDGIYSEHIKNASDKLIPLLSMCFTGFLMHGYLPISLMSVVIIPIIKNKCGNISSK